MFLKNKNKIYVTAAIIVCVGVLLAWFLCTFAPPANDSIVTDAPRVSGNFRTVQIGKAAIRVELATTEAEQILGLSGRTSLATSTGLLFVFKNLGRCGIWMKDMNFPIDVLWITDDLKVSDIVENMTPASYPKVYASHVPVKYVLELPVGTVRDGGIAVGQDVVLK